MTTTERGPGGWPVDPVAAFHEAQGKFHEARKEAAHWRSNHADLVRRVKADEVYRADLVESATLLKRVVEESGADLPGELYRAIDRFLAKVEKSLESPSGSHTS